MPPKKAAKIAETTRRASARVKTVSTKAVPEPSAPARNATASTSKGKNAQPSAASAHSTKRKMADEDLSSRPVKQVKTAPVTVKKTPATKATGAKETATKATATKATAKKPTAAKATSRKTVATEKAETTAAPANDAKRAVTKRKAADEEDTSPRPTKRASVSETPKAEVSHPIKIARHGRRSTINEAPTERLNIYVFGEGSSGELGLGSARAAVDVKRPRLNPNLAADSVGVVQIASGGMHAVALTHDNKILTWGVNDLGAVGRDTEWKGGLKDIDDTTSDGGSSDDGSSDGGSDDNSDSGMNPKESTPAEVLSQYFEEGTKFVQVAAGDSASFAVTDEGYVYGWGTFRNSEGVLGFTKDSHIQYRPVYVPGLKKIKSIAMGNNHALALDNKGTVFAWGSGQQNQLGRRLVERTAVGGLVPREFGLPKNKIRFVACGSYHSFAIDNKGRVWAWGANSYCETGVLQGLGDDNSVVAKPTLVESLKEYEIVYVAGGDHHSLAVTKDGDLLVWGRLDGFQVGVKVEDIPQDSITFDGNGIPRILHKPVKIEGLKVSMVAAGSDNSIAITTDGKAYSWGFSSNYQTGQGTEDDVEVATLLANSAVRGKRLTWAGCGGQYSMVAGPAEDAIMVNGEREKENDGGVKGFGAKGTESRGLKKTK